MSTERSTVQAQSPRSLGRLGRFPRRRLFTPSKNCRSSASRPRSGMAAPRVIAAPAPPAPCGTGAGRGSRGGAVIRIGVIGWPRDRPERRGGDRRGGADDGAGDAERPSQRERVAQRAIVLRLGIGQRQGREPGGEQGRNRDWPDVHRRSLRGRSAGHHSRRRSNEQIPIAFRPLRRLPSPRGFHP